MVAQENLVKKPSLSPGQCGSVGWKHQTISQGVTGLISGQGMRLGCGFCPCLERMVRGQLIDVSLLLPLRFFFPSL